MTQSRQIGYFTQVTPNLALVQPIPQFGQAGQQQQPPMLMMIAQPDQVSSAFSTNFNTPQQWGNRPYQLLNPQFRGGTPQGQSWQADQTRETNLAAQFMQLMRYFFQKLMEILFGNRLLNSPDGEAGNPDNGGLQPISAPDGTAGLEDGQGGPAIPGAVAANETARAHGDPHIVGGNGAKYDFDEIGTFNLLEDKDVRVNAEMGPAAGEKSVITKTGLKLGNDNLEINPKGQIKINDQPVNLEEGQALRMRDGSLISKKNGRIKVDTKEYSLNFIPRANGQYLDVEAKTRGIGVVSDGVPPSGILGETFDGNYGRQTKSKFNPEAYRRVGLYN